jgi:hypothetical protein
MYVALRGGDPFGNRPHGLRPRRASRCPVGPNAERQWPIENGAVDGNKVTFRVQQPDGPMRTFTLQLVKGRLQGEMLAELKGQSFTAKVDAGRAKDAKDK